MDEFNDAERERESLDNAAPQNACGVCGRHIGWPWDVDSAIRCTCGADNWQQPPLRIVRDA
jgi:hypothetical protein